MLSFQQNVALSESDDPEKDVSFVNADSITKIITLFLAKVKRFAQIFLLAENALALSDLLDRVARLYDTIRQDVMGKFRFDENNPFLEIRLCPVHSVEQKQFLFNAFSAALTAHSFDFDYQFHAKNFITIFGICKLFCEEKYRLTSKVQTAIINI